MENDQRFREALREQAETTRRRLGAAPTPEEVLAYVEGRLQGEEHERVADGIAVFPEAARLARDLARFPAVEADEGVEPETETEPVEAWRVVRARLAAGDERTMSEAPSPAPLRRFAQPAKARPRRGVPGWLAVAAALVAMVLGGTLSRLWDFDAPEPNPEVRTLQPRGAAATRGALPQPVRVPPESDRLVLVLAYAGPAGPGPHALSLRDAGGAVRWSTEELRRRADGTFTAAMPRRFLGSGAYTFELSATGDPLAEPLAVYDLVVEPSGGG